jgi:solute carrier family 38 (sodium-coupled neutral amino acid transporter), member 11
MEDWYSLVLFLANTDRGILGTVLFCSRRYGVLLRHYRYFDLSSKIDNCVGDTIPHVLAAVFPGLRTSTLFSFLINRQVVIILCTALVSYPLSLYRDITKLAKASALALVSMVIIVYTVVSEGPNVPEEYRGTKVRLIPSGFGIFQAIGVISFGNIPQYYRR